ncbi:MAG: GumC family protein, partial [Hyphomicrobiales bacterium]
DPLQKELTGSEVLPSGLGSSALGADTGLVESQVAIMKSASVLNRVISKLGLDQDAEFIGNDDNSIIDITGNIVRLVLYGDVETYQRSPYDKAKRKLEKRVAIERLGSTYVVRIQARSADPEKAAKIANLLAESYAAEGRDYYSSSTQHAADDIGGRLQELRETMQTSTRAVEAFREANGLVGAQNVLVAEQQLFEVNRKLSDAQATSRVEKSKLDEARRAIANPLSGDLKGLDSPLAVSLLGRLAAARSEEATLKTTLLPQHPRLSAVGQQINSIETAINTELERVVNRHETAYKVAQQNELALTNQVAELQQATANSNSDSVRLRELQMEADLNRQLYEKFRARTNQIKEEVALEPSTIRIVSAAYPASRPSHPKGLLLLLASLIAGFMTGCFFAWCLHIFKGTERKQNHKTSLPIQRIARTDISHINNLGTQVAQSSQRGAP